MLVGVPDIGLVLEAYDASNRSTAWWLVLGVAATLVIAWGATDPGSRRR